MGVAITTSEGIPDRVQEHPEKRTSARTVKLYAVSIFNLGTVNVVSLASTKVLLSKAKPSLAVYLMLMA